ncbi:hypothetical protein [Rheinheimera hassiensis]|uniref:hypothetical protein n=1 Tax=Rheinheimera hassiensis TaxID=1193627 RepID=UPI001F06CAB2|nr:hypothetical protein [Rheinheimera hassiensis]
MKNKEALSRFTELLKQSKTTFLQSGSKIHLGNGTVTFIDQGVSIIRLGVPDRIIPYSNLNIDRLYSLVCHPIADIKQVKATSGRESPVEHLPG